MLFTMVPLAKAGRHVTLALGDPFDVVGLDKFRDATGLEVTPVVAPRQQCVPTRCADPRGRVPIGESQSFAC